VLKMCKCADEKDYKIDVVTIECLRNVIIRTSAHLKSTHPQILFGLNLNKLYL
jgi:hypothetical protein